MQDIFTRKSDYKKWNGVSAFSNEIKEKANMLTESSVLEEKINYKNSFTNNTSNRVMTKNSKLNLMEEVRVRGTERAFGFFLAETYYDSLVMDDDFKETRENEIKSFFISKLKEEANGDIYKFMESSKGKNKVVDKIIDDSKKKGKKLEEKCSKKLDEKGNENIDKFDIEDYLDDEETEDEIDYDKVDVNEIATVVKDKVIEVIKQEEERNKASDEFVEDIKNAKAIDESSTIFIKGNEEFTLFKSMMMHNYKSTINQIKEENISESVYGFIDEDNSIKVNMDYIMCDTIMEYTNLELYHTLGLKQFSSNEIRKLAEAIAYKR